MWGRAVRPSTVVPCARRACAHQWPLRLGGGSAWGPGVSTELPKAPRLSRDQGWMWPGPGLLWDMVTAI